MRPDGKFLVMYECACGGDIYLRLGKMAYVGLWAIDVWHKERKLVREPLDIASTSDALAISIIERTNETMKLLRDNYRSCKWRYQ